MKRKGYLYDRICDLKNIQKAYKEVCQNTKNKRKVFNYQQYKCVYIERVYNVLKNKKYEVGKYNVFYITDPKRRRIVSQSIQDKIVNHLVSREILYPALLPCLIEENVASRINKGTKEGLRLFYEYKRKCDVKYKKYYILKCDISKYFASFYLNDMDHYIKEILKIKYYVRYQDDFLLFHESKEYLKICVKKIEEFLRREKLKLNSKTRIYNSNNNFIFLGRTKKGKYSRYRIIKRRLKNKKYYYEKGYIPLYSFVTTKICYKNLLKNID